MGPRHRRNSRRCRLAWAIVAATGLFASSLVATDALASGGGSKRNRVSITYVPPTEQAHAPILTALKERRALERIQALLAGVPLPRRLTLAVEGCDGEINASYDDSTTRVTICYEYLAYIQETSRDLPRQAIEAGLTPQTYVVGPFLEVVLHEVAHALFDLLKVPILGREEDAADQLAAYILLQLDDDEARQVILSIATMYAQEAQDIPTKLKEFADEHGTPAQRFFNLLCIGYGARPMLFADVVEKGFLPAERAHQCAAEYRQVSYAVSRLIAPHLGGDAKGRREALRRSLRP